MQEGCKLPSRHGHVTWFGINAYVHGTPRLFRSPSCTTPPMAMPASKGKCPQDTESRAPPPSLSVTRPKSTTELLHQGGGLLFPRTKCRCHSTPRQRVTRQITSCLPQQDFSQGSSRKNKSLLQALS